MSKVRQPAPIVLAQPLEERVDKAAERQRAGHGPASREQGRRDSEDAAGYWYHDGDGNWEYLGEEEPGKKGRSA